MSETARDRILTACYSFLVPVARFLLHRGLSYREFEEIARTAYVKVATDEYGIRGRPTNASRVAAMTGIPRKDVTRIREQIKVYEVTPKADLSPLGDVLHRWYTDTDFLDAKGRPLTLALEGEDPSLETLVRRCVGDLPIGAIKVELLRTGAITQDSAGNFAPSRRQVVPISPDDRLITSISFNLHGLASTISFNSNPDRKEEGRIERFVQSDPLSAAQKRSLRLPLRKRIVEFTESLDDMFSAVEGDVNDSTDRVGVGIYYFEED